MDKRNLDFLEKLVKKGIIPSEIAGESSVESETFETVDYTTVSVPKDLEAKMSIAQFGSNYHEEQIIYDDSDGRALLVQLKGYLTFLDFAEKGQIFENEFHIDLLGNYILVAAQRRKDLLSTWQKANSGNNMTVVWNMLQFPSHSAVGNDSMVSLIKYFAFRKLFVESTYTKKLLELAKSSSGITLKFYPLINHKEYLIPKGTNKTEVVTTLADGVKPLAERNSYDGLYAIYYERYASIYLTEAKVSKVLEGFGKRSKLPTFFRQHHDGRHRGKVNHQISWQQLWMKDPERKTSDGKPLWRPNYNTIAENVVLFWCKKLGLDLESLMSRELGTMKTERPKDERQDI